MAGGQAAIMESALAHVNLSSEEAEVFHILRAVSSHFSLDVDLYAIGDWVLAKALGKVPVNIYIAVSKLTVDNFFEHVIEYLKVHPLSYGASVISSRQHGPPHLMMRGKIVWFLSMKQEAYDGTDHNFLMTRDYDNSDLFHGDLTINSLLWDIRKSGLVDFTGLALIHIREGLISTAVGSESIIMKNPVIVLRAVRIAAQLDFRLDEAMMRSASTEEFRNALSRVSREKIFGEINLMLSSSHPVKAFELISAMGFFDILFQLPNMTETEFCDRTCITHLDEVWNLLAVTGLLCVASPTQQSIWLYAALLISLSNTVYENNAGAKVPVVEYVLRDIPALISDDGIAGPVAFGKYASIVKSVSLIHSNCERFADLLYLVESDDHDELIKRRLDDQYIDIPTDRVKHVFAGLVLREVKELWRFTLLLSIVMYGEVNVKKDKTSVVKELFTRTEIIVANFADKIWEHSPVLDLNTIRASLHMNANDPSIEQWQERVMKWQLLNPEGTPDDCENWIKLSLQEKQSDVTLNDYFKKALVKINANENGLLEKVKLLDNESAYSMKDNCCRLASSWVEMVTGAHTENRSWEGNFTLDTFGVRDHRVYIIKIPVRPAVSFARQADCKKLASLMRVKFCLNGELAAYMEDLLKKLEELPRGPITESSKLAFDTHFAVLTSEARLAKIYLFKLRLASGEGFLLSEVHEILNSVELSPGWLERMENIHVFGKLIAWSKEKGYTTYVDECGMAAFSLIRNFYTHAPEYCKEKGLDLLKHLRVIDLVVYKRFGVFAASAIFGLIEGNFPGKRESRASLLH